MRYFNWASHNLHIKYFELSSQYIIKYERVLHVCELRTRQIILGYDYNEPLMTKQNSVWHPAMYMYKYMYRPKNIIK